MGSYKFVTGIEMINNGKKYLVGGDCSHSPHLQTL